MKSLPKSIIALSLLWFALGFRVFASPQGIAIPVFIADPVAQGDVISVVSGVYEKTNIAYDSLLFGVVAPESFLSLENPDRPQDVLVLSSGLTQVRVSTVNGNIQTGDLLTSSEIAGVAQKATTSGYTLGSALQDFSSTNPEETGLIWVYVDVKFMGAGERSGTRENLAQLLQSGFTAPFLTPLTSLRYLLAAVLVSGAFVIGFFSFVRSTTSSVQAVGRNPLAQGVIKRVVVFNFILTGAILLTGLSIAYLILVL